MKERSTLRWKSLPKWAKIGAFSLAFIIIAGFSANIYLNRLITRQLKEAVRNASKGIYSFNYEKVHVNVFGRTITIDQGELRADTMVFRNLLSSSSTLPLIVEGKFPIIKISGIHWMKFLFSKGVAAGTLSLGSPNMVLTQFKLREKDSINSLTNGIEEFFTKSLKEIQIKNLAINDANLQYHYFDEERKGPTFYEFRKLQLDIKDFKINPNKDNRSQKFSVERADLSFADYEYHTGDSLYIMALKDFAYSSVNRTVTISKVFIRPRLSEKEYAYKMPYQKERNDLSLDKVTLEGVEVWPLLNKGEMNIHQAIIDNGYWNIYLSRVPPLPSIRKKVVPTQPLLSISQPVYLANLKINKLQLDYKEYNTATEQTGEIKFNDVNGTATNITNEKGRIEKNAHLVVNLNARLMGTGDFKARFDFLLSDTTGRFSVDAHLGKMDAIQLNPGFIPLNKVEIKKGTIDEMHCTGMGNENGLSGKVGLLYHDLHIAVMEKDKEADTLKRKTFISLVANILVKNDNPKKDEPVRTANNIVLNRDRRKSYFNLLWMALFTGIVKIVSGK